MVIKELAERDMVSGEVGASVSEKETRRILLGVVALIKNVAADETGSFTIGFRVNPDRSIDLTADKKRGW